MGAVRLLRLDVMSDQSVHEVMALAGQLDVPGEGHRDSHYSGIEEFSIEEAKNQFETNFFGVARMTKYCIMRKQKEAR